MQDLQDLVRRILVLQPSQRLGASRNGAADVKQHPWFKGFDWAAFSARQLPAPYMPQVRWLLHALPTLAFCSAWTLLPITTAAVIQVKKPEDVSNFVPPPPAPGKRGSAQRYQSTGVFKDF